MTEPTCRWPNCLSAARARGFCATHYYRARRVENFSDPWTEWKDSRRRKKALCAWPECAIEEWGRGFCHKHYQRARSMGDFKSPWLDWWQRICEECGLPVRGRNREQRFCSDDCGSRAWKAANKDRVRELARRHSSSRRARILGSATERFTEADVRARTGDNCYLCSSPIRFQLRWPHPQSPSLDHIHPLSKGGTHTLENVAMTHLACNNIKNDRVLDAMPMIAPAARPSVPDRGVNR